MAHFAVWVRSNNLKLKSDKYRESLPFRRSGFPLPTPFLGSIKSYIRRYSGSIYVVTFLDHISEVLTFCARSQYALRILKTHGLSPESLYLVAQATTLSRLLSSVVSIDTVSLYMRPLALCWLPDLLLPIVWLPIALHWLPTTRFFITRAPNMVTRLDVELQPTGSLHWLPASGSTSRALSSEV